jgi:hypothetical protein
MFSNFKRFEQFFSCKLKFTNKSLLLSFKDKNLSSLHPSSIVVDPGLGSGAFFSPGYRIPAQDPQHDLKYNVESYRKFKILEIYPIKEY